MTEADAAPEFAVIAQGAMDLLKDVQRALRETGMRAELMQPPDGCGSS